MSLTIFISGHLDLTHEEFTEHYEPLLKKCLASGYVFVVGDARGCDTMSQQWLRSHGAMATVFHMFHSPRNNHEFPCRGGFGSDAARDEAMTAASDADVAWVRPGRENSGTAKNLKRRMDLIEDEARKMEMEK